MAAATATLSKLERPAAARVNIFFHSHHPRCDKQDLIETSYVNEYVNFLFFFFFKTGSSNGEKISRDWKPLFRVAQRAVSEQTETSRNNVSSVPSMQRRRQTGGKMRRLSGQLSINITATETNKVAATTGITSRSLVTVTGAVTN